MNLDQAILNHRRALENRDAATRKSVDADRALNEATKNLQEANAALHEALENRAEELAS